MTQAPDSGLLARCQCRIPFPSVRCPLHPGGNSPHSPVGRRRAVVDLQQLKRANLVERIRMQSKVDGELDALLAEEMEILQYAFAQQQLDDYLNYELTEDPVPEDEMEQCRDVDKEMKV